MVLLAGVFAGTITGTIFAWKAQSSWRPPQLQRTWLVAVGFLPQFLAFYFPVTRESFSNGAASLCLIISLVILLTFCMMNWKHKGMLLLALGLVLNLVVILANGGFMPLATDTVAKIFPTGFPQNLEVGERVGYGSKDILLHAEQIIFPILADRFTMPQIIPYRFVFSLGDILIAVGAFWLLAFPSRSRITGE